MGILFLYFQNQVACSFFHLKTYEHSDIKFLQKYSIIYVVNNCQKNKQRHIIRLKID